MPVRRRESSANIRSRVNRRSFHQRTGLVPGCTGVQGRMANTGAVNLIGSYNYALVALSVLIAMFASYAALDLAGRRGRCDGNWHLVHALHWDAGANPIDSRGLPLADGSPVTVCGHSRVGHRAVRGEPTETGCGPSGRRKCPDGCGFLPGFKEGIDPRPSVEHDGNTILLEDAISFPHRGFEPRGTCIILDSAVRTVTIVHQVRWIGENEIGTLGSHLPHNLDAIAVEDLVREAARLCLD